MAGDPEARSQLVRLLQDESLRAADPDAVRRTIESQFDVLVSGLVAEAAAGDDVYDHASALSFIEMRLNALADVLGPALQSRLRDAVRAKIEAW